LQTLPLDLLATIPTVQPSSQTEQTTTDKTLVVEKISEKEKTPEQEQEQENDSELIDLDIHIDPKLLKEWQ